MKTRVEFREAALRDAEGLVEHLAEESPRAAERFVESLQAAVRRLATHPRIGHPVESRIATLSGLRTWPVPGFPAILLVLIVDRRGVSILRMVHGARDLPGLMAPSDD